MTPNEIKAGLQTMDSIRELKQVPEGTLYAVVMGKMSLEAFNKVIGILCNAGLIKCEGHVLTWIAK